MDDQQEARLITDSRHPLYTLNDIYKFRTTSIGGRQFIDAYLEKFDSREDVKDFDRRKKLTHNPGFAAQALNEIISGITQRMPEIIRTAGTESYMRAVEGKDGGVDLKNSGMNQFIGQQILPELLGMGRVGVYVDMPKFNPYSTLADLGGQPHPYLYWYKAEDILNWNQVYFNNELITTAVLLRETHPDIDPRSGLPQGNQVIYRLIRLTSEGVILQLMDQYQDLNNRGRLSERVLQEFRLPLKRIPFVLYDIGRSLLTDAADIQIGLLNLASAVLSYAINSNFPFYVEGYDTKAENVHGKQGPQTKFDADGNALSATNASGDAQPERVVGTMHGRRYPYEAPPPSFIHPSPEPLRVSMDKQRDMKEDIRRLLNLNVTNIVSSRTSAEAKRVDQSSGLESGLSAIGIELEGGEREIAYVWAQYEGATGKELTVAYPTTYSLKTDDQRISEAKSLQEVQGVAPSKTFAKEVAKLAVKSVLAGKVTTDTISKINKEIDSANYITGDWEAVQADFQLGIVDPETAAEARGYDPAKVKDAQDAHVKRMADIAAAQTTGQGAALSAARGIQGGAPDASAEKTTSQNADTNPKGGKAVRGKA